MKDIPERDWKILRDMMPDKLNLFCAQVLKKVPGIIESPEQTPHENYLALWKMMQEEDREIAYMFNEVKRSTAFHKLASLRRNSLVSDEEMQRFTQETQETINIFLSE